MMTLSAPARIIASAVASPRCPGPSTRPTSPALKAGRSPPQRMPDAIEFTRASASSGAAWRDLVQQGAAGHVDQFGEAAPQVGLAVGRDQPVAEQVLARVAQRVVTGDAERAGPAGHDRLGHHPVPRCHPPAAGRPGADGLDRADEHVPEDHRVDRARRAELAQVLGDVAAAEAAHLHPDQGVVLAEARDGKGLDAEGFRGGKHRGPDACRPCLASSRLSLPGGRAAGGRARCRTARCRPRSGGGPAPARSRTARGCTRGRRACPAGSLPGSRPPGGRSRRRPGGRSARRSGSPRRPGR